MMTVCAERAVSSRISCDNWDLSLLSDPHSHIMTGQRFFTHQMFLTPPRWFALLTLHWRIILYEYESSVIELYQNIFFTVLKEPWSFSKTLKWKMTRNFHSLQINEHKRWKIFRKYRHTHCYILLFKQNSKIMIITSSQTTAQTEGLTYNFRQKIGTCPSKIAFKNYKLVR